MGQSYNKWERYYHQLHLIFNGIVASSLIPFLFVFLETKKGGAIPLILDEIASDLVMGACLLLTIGMLVFALKSRKKQLATIDAHASLAGQLRQYLRVKLRLYVWLEIAGLSSLAGLYITKVQLFVFFYLIVLFVFSQVRPTYDSVVQEMKLKEDEEARLKVGDF